MRVWHMIAPERPLELVDVPEPKPGPGQVLVDIKAAGLCHSDVGFIDGDMAWMLEKMPIVLGHEVAGTICALGEGVNDFAVGDRVGIAGDGLDAPGIVADGGFGQKCIGKVDQLVPIPENVSFEQAAAGTDAGMTSYHAVHTVGGVTKDTRVGIIGLGGLGLTGVKIAVGLEAQVYAAEIDDDLHELGLAAGVEAVVHNAEDLARFELDVIVDFAGARGTTTAAVASVNPSGRVVQVGMAHNEMTLPTQTLVTKQVQLIGSLGGKKQDTAAVYDLMARNLLQILVKTITFDEIPKGLNELRSGKVRGRLVAVAE